LGYIKKTVIANNISPIVDEVFANPTNYNGLSVMTGVWLYTTQVFCDFSGYTDMAIAVAGFLGYKLVPNFESPYLSLSVHEFWRRWHISLSTWFRDYIYISLGGKTKNNLITYKNIFLTMLIGGLWHGAAWTYVAWGAVHGSALIFHREFQKIKVFPNRFLSLKKILSWFITINFICCTMIIFRASSFEIIPILIKKYFFFKFYSGTQISHWLILIGPTLLAVQYFFNRFEIDKKWAKLNPIAFTIILSVILSFTFSLLPLGYKPFIYFQF
jgi:alginate O-acetyltransferase complex protein AlgI